MAYMHGNVEARFGDTWVPVINVASLILHHSDLNGCLFGVDNYAGFSPLFADRGPPADADGASAEITQFSSPEYHMSWALWSELNKIDWSEYALRRDARTTEYEIDENKNETYVTKWLNKQGLEWIKGALDKNPATEIRSGNRMYKRCIIRRSDALTDTEFPLMMKLMDCLASRFGEESVRLVVWFE